MFSIRKDIDPQLYQYASTLDGKYKIIETIGEGRYAKVKLAKDLHSNKLVAIKIIKRQMTNSHKRLDGFLQEAVKLVQCKHHSVINILQVNIKGHYQKYDGRQFKTSYLAMELAEHGDLFRFLQLTPRFSEPMARYIFIQILDCLEHLHQQKIAHLDIKPENLLLGKSFEVILADFGFAHATHAPEGTELSLNPLSNVGTPEYAVPETHQNQSYKGVEQDVFASACVLFQLVMNSLPFSIASMDDPYYCRFQSNAPNYWKIFEPIYTPSEAFKDLLTRMLALDPSKRLSIKSIREHPWLQASTPSHQEFKLEMQRRLKQIGKTHQKTISQKRRMKIQKCKGLLRQEPRVESPTHIDEHKHKLFTLQNSLNQKIQEQLELSMQERSAVFQEQNEPGFQSRNTRIEEKHGYSTFEDCDNYLDYSRSSDSFQEE